MYLSIDTTEPLSDRDRAVLSALLGTETPAPERPASQPAPVSAPKAAPLKAVRDPEPEPPVDDLFGTPAEPDRVYTMKDAVDEATKVINSNAGKSESVKAVLDDLEVPRISELKGDKIRLFVEALQKL